MRLMAMGSDIAYGNRDRLYLIRFAIMGIIASIALYMYFVYSWPRYAPLTHRQVTIPFFSETGPSLLHGLLFLFCFGAIVSSLARARYLRAGVAFALGVVVAHEVLWFYSHGLSNLWPLSVVGLLITTGGPVLAGASLASLVRSWLEK